MDRPDCRPAFNIRVFLLGLLLIPMCPPAARSQERASRPKHPVLSHRIDPARAEAYEMAAEQVMAMSEEEMLSFVPEKPFTQFCYCPNCHGGSQGSGVFKWTIDKPEQLECNYCGMVFPNAKYPTDRLLKGANALGETVTYKYHQDQVRDDLQIFIEGQILAHKRGWITRQLTLLARAYHATRKPGYARRAALILDRIAQVYPHYPMMRQWITTFEFGPQKPPYPSAGGRWGRWMASELPDGVIEAYDLVYDSSELDKLSQERGYSVRERIEKDFFRAAFDYVNTFDKHDGNMSPFYLRTAVYMGRVLNEPRYVHWAYRWLLEILHGGCFYDGCWKEAPSYHYQVMGGLARAFEGTRGYSDPRSYLDNVDGKRFDNLDPDEDIAFFAKARDAFRVICFPNGRCPPVHDTWPNERRSSPRESTGSALLPGYGHASLGSGQGEHQIQVQLHFSGGYGHQHLDNLNLSLFAKGREMLSDIGYTHTKLRCWCISTIGHNTVVIDRTSQAGGNSDGDLLAFHPNVAGLSIVEADGKRAYRDIEGLETYRRLIMLVSVSRNDAYVVDLFTAVGGRTHDWLLHGDADRDMEADCDVQLTGRRENMLEKGEVWQAPRTEQSRFNPYGVVKEIAGGHIDGQASIQFAYSDKPDTGVRLHVVGGVDTELFLGKSPSVRRAGRDSPKVFDFWMPQLILRRTSSSQKPLRSLFTVVEEPFSGQPFIDSVVGVDVNPADDGVAALQVRYGDTADTILKTDDEPPYPERATAAGVRIRGRLGLVRQRGGRVARLWLVDGELLQCGDARLHMSTGRYQGGILDAIRKADGAEHDALITDAELPVGDELQGLWIIITHANGFTHGYPIERVHRRDRKTLIVPGMDHGLKIDGAETREIYFPRRTITGTNSFVIPLSATLTAGAE